MEIDVVLSGGGIRSLAFISALDEMEKSGFRIHSIGGVSGGAVIAVLFAAGYRYKELCQLVEETPFKRLFPLLSIRTVWRFLWRWGLWSPLELERFLQRLLSEKGYYTFAQFHEGEYAVVATDLTRGKLVVFPRDLADYTTTPHLFSLAKATTMSALYPFYFEPYRYVGRGGERSLFVDGGVVRQFPVQLFPMSTRRQIGLRLQEEAEYRLPSSLIGYGEQLLTLLKRSDFAEQEGETITIETDVASMSFQLSTVQLCQLIEQGRKAVQAYFRA